MTDQTRPRWVLASIIFTLLIGLPALALSQSALPQDREQILRDLDALIKMRQEMSSQMQEFDKRIKALEEQPRQPTRWSPASGYALPKM